MYIMYLVEIHFVLTFIIIYKVTVAFTALLFPTVEEVLR